MDNHNPALQLDLFKQVNDLFNEAMNDNFIVDGVVYNMKKLGYTWGWGTSRRRAGACKIRKNRTTKQITRRRIELSKWVLLYSNKTYDQWFDTILHEIAHGIDYERRGTSGHDYAWEYVAKQIGCSADKCYTAEFDTTASKYYLECVNCGTKTPSHKKLRTTYACNKCCNEHNGGRYSEKYKLIQHQNY